MPYVISDGCIQSKDQACIDVCPVDCIYEAEGRMWIQPDECTECGACESVCPVMAITYVDAESAEQDLREAHEFFSTLLPGRDSPIGSPRGAQKIGLIKSDHPRILQQLKGLAKD
ncbi:4Fe-4S dicluster domain-containing protein [Pseudomonas veronii]|uniref:4Fe-4S dicluster domain-containing protein n=1 Tax=Pseudomonas veronii TaxID=76761 RepID=UPI000F82D314|nr:ferredoxin family protein [Pseudomonas veronii]RTY78709.1 4Fe-4S dicluster domain-containing protein [Pseudomonas veronii]